MLERGALQHAKDVAEPAVDGCGANSQSALQTPNKPTRRGLPATPQSDLPSTEKDVESPQPVEESPLRAIPRDGWGQGFSSPESGHHENTFEQQSPQKTDGYGTPSPEKEAFPNEDFLFLCNIYSNH